MVAAGIEGGSWNGVRMNTGMREYMLLQQHWLQYGSPVYVSVASYLGAVKPKKVNAMAKRAAQHADELKQMLHEVQNG